MKKILSVLLLVTFLTEPAHAVSTIRFKTPSSGIFGKSSSSGVINNRTGNTFTAAQLSLLRLWLDPSDTSTITAIATFTMGNGSGTTMTIQCKQNVMPVSINFISDQDPNGASYNPTTRIMTVETNAAPPDFFVSLIADNINALPGYTAIVTGLDDEGASSVSRGSLYVVQIDDKSGNGNHAVQGTQARRPITGAATINGRNVISFDGPTNDQFLSISNMSVSPNTLMAVYKTDETTFAEWNGVITARAVPNSTKVSASPTSSGFTGQAGGTSVVNVGQSTVAAYLDGVTGSAANFDNFLVGLPSTPMASPHMLLLTDDLSSGTYNYCIGADTFDVVGARHWNGKIGEIVITNSAISDTQRVAFTNRTKQYWGIA